MKHILIFSLLFSVFSVNADELGVDIGLHAHHWDRAAVKRYNFNEFTPGIGLRLSEGDYHKLIGIYHNSARRTSTYALAAWTPLKVYDIKIGAITGVVTGYIKQYKPVVGMYIVIPVRKDTSINVTLVPDVPSMNVWGFAGFQASFKF